MYFSRWGQRSKPIVEWIGRWTGGKIEVTMMDPKTRVRRRYLNDNAICSVLGNGAKAIGEALKVNSTVQGLTLGKYNCSDGVMDRVSPFPDHRLCWKNRISTCPSFPLYLSTHFRFLTVHVIIDIHDIHTSTTK